MQNEILLTASEATCMHHIIVYNEKCTMCVKSVARSTSSFHTITVRYSSRLEAGLFGVGLRSNDLLTLVLLHDVLNTRTITYSICGQYCFIACGLISAAQGNDAEPDSDEEYKFSKPNIYTGSLYLTRVLKLINQWAVHMIHVRQYYGTYLGTWFFVSGAPNGAFFKTSCCFLQNLVSHICLRLVSRSQLGIS